MLEFSDNLESSERNRLVKSLTYHLKTLLPNHGFDKAIPDSMQQVERSREIIKEIRAPNKKLKQILVALDDLLKTVKNPSDIDDEWRGTISPYLEELKDEG